jgi:tryptophan-rich sensory protein
MLALLQSNIVLIISVVVIIVLATTIVKKVIKLGIFVLLLYLAWLVYHSGVLFTIM